MSNNKRNNFRKREETTKHRINDRIRVSEVRLVGDNIDTDVYSTQEAMVIADDLGLDLVEISPNAEPPVCKIIDYNKFLYNEKKMKKDQEKKQRENLIEKKSMEPFIKYLMIYNTFLNNLSD